VQTHVVPLYRPKCTGNPTQSLIPVYDCQGTRCFKSTILSFYLLPTRLPPPASRLPPPATLSPRSTHPPLIYTAPLYTYSRTPIRLTYLPVHLILSSPKVQNREKSSGEVGGAASEGERHSRGGRVGGGRG
jgi:hypothetical protein